MVDTYLAETVQAVEGKERYDTCVKEMLADKQVLSRMQGIIRLRKNSNVEKSRNELINMLEILLRKGPAENKKKALEQYGFVMNSESERKVNEMCNLSEWMIEQGFEQGIAQTYYDLVQSGELSAARAAEKMGIALEVFLEQMKTAGFNAPLK